MKNKFLNLLFLFCGLVLIVGPAKAEESKNDYSSFEVDVAEESQKGGKDYSVICSNYTETSERINCCNQASDPLDQSACKKPIYQVCMEESNIAKRQSCCAQKFTGSELEDCESQAVKYCSLSEQVRLSKAAAAVKVEYEPVELKADGYDDVNSPNYSVMIYALDIKVYLII